MAGELKISKEEWRALRAEATQALPGLIADGLLPEVLIPYQQKLLHTTAHTRVTVVEKSRRTGFTWGIAADAVLTSAASRQAKGMDTLYIGYNLEMAREFIDACGMWAKAFHQAATAVEEFLFRDPDDVEGDKDIQAFRIRFASGFEIVALASRPRSLRGKQGYVIIDEAAFHDKLAEMLKAAMALLMWGGKVLVISTHDGVENPFNELVEDCRKKRKPYALITLDFDEALKQGLYQRICLVTGETWSPEREADWRDEIIAFYGDDADEELFCIPKASGGAYLPGPLLDASQIPDVPIARWQMPDSFTLQSEATRIAEATAWCEREIKPHFSRCDASRQSYIGMDIARSGDLTVQWPAQRLQNMRLVPPFLVELRNIPFDIQRFILFYVINGLPRFSAGVIDATGIGAQLAEETRQRYGERIVAQKLSEQFYIENMPMWKRGFEDQLIGIPRDDDVYRDHRAVKVIRGVPKVPRDDSRKIKGEDGKGGMKGMQRHGDSAIANFLMHCASRIEVAPIEFMAANTRDGSYGDYSGGRLDLGGYQ
ncbi:MAG: terminase family protein [Alphaproteobacteria bacterium]|nr:terminase family protein [Alphaproteobacteria bacterium]